MRNYLFGSGLIGAVTSGIALLRGSREEPFTWRVVLAWLSWGITLALAIGAIVDMNRERKGLELAPDSPVAKDATKHSRKREKELQKQLRSHR